MDLDLICLSRYRRPNSALNTAENGTRNPTLKHGIGAKQPLVGRVEMGGFVAPGCMAILRVQRSTGLVGVGVGGAKR